MKQQFFSRTGLLLWIGASIGAICILPYANHLTPEAFDNAARQTGLPVILIVFISTMQSVVVLGLLVFSGLWSAKKVGLGASLLDAWLNGKPLPDDHRRIAGIAIGLGIAGAIVAVALDLTMFVPLDPDGLGAIDSARPPAWMGFLASVYGGIAEEVQLRLFLLSFMALSVSYVGKLLGFSGISEISSRMFRIVNVVVAVVFGLAHLPATAELLPLTPLIVFRAIMLNGIIGLVAGYLFWRRGIEMAMLCHFSADIVLHVVVPLVTPD